jgi:hypothetical protein
MNLEIGPVAAQFPEKAKINGIFVAVWRASPLAVVLVGSQSPTPRHSSLSLIVLLSLEGRSVGAQSDDSKKA